MLKQFRYKNWVRLLRGKNILPETPLPIDWESLKQEGQSLFIALPNDSRHIHVVNHLLNQLLSQQPSLNISVYVPPAFEDFIRGMKFYKEQFILPAIKPLSFPISEEMIPDTFKKICDIGIDLNCAPYILSHYLIATRSKKASLGFYNLYSSSLFSMTLKIKPSSYDSGVEALLNLIGITLLE
ncbi:MAG: hypothetical protein PHE86_02070 [Candidatus Marinimicrobia bacterium]|nr:hypothetical protein [Candidatus Neomarinimicrobiota bacterium]MDD5582823.1 hypothetical protein [Candidatus Neomarinimicrobiota bacterium]